MRVKELLIATTNSAKLSEIKEFLSDLPVACVGLENLGITQVIEETGATFEENAMLKARRYAELSHLPTLADDGGLEIDALQGEPGVHSHRWIHKDREDEDEELIQYAIQRLEGVPEHKRTAKLRLVLALALPDGSIYTSEGAIQGIIAKEPSSYRRKGFPYRSLLYIPEIQKFYNHEALSKEEHEAYNHRKKALEELKPIIRNIVR